MSARSGGDAGGRHRRHYDDPSLGPDPHEDAASGRSVRLRSRGHREGRPCRRLRAAPRLARPRAERGARVPHRHRRVPADLRFGRGPKERPASITFASARLTEAKKDGTVPRIFDAHGLSAQYRALSGAPAPLSPAPAHLDRRELLTTQTAGRAQLRVGPAGALTTRACRGHGRGSWPSRNAPPPPLPARHVATIG